MSRAYDTGALHPFHELSQAALYIALGSTEKDYGHFPRFCLFGRRQLR
jgi:hypothetical protein